jgi:phenylalanyl-tRNA synthetase beta chain
MKLSLNWLRDFVTLPKDLDPKELLSLLTRHTAEVEGIEDQAESYKNLVVGQIKSVAKHPNADRLNVAQVDTGDSSLRQIVCGGQNLKPEMKVAVALPGAQVHFHGGEEVIEIKDGVIRGEQSSGMICAGEEIGLEADNVEGVTTEVRIKDLSHLNDAPGTPLAKALGREDSILEIDNKSITHRPDLWGHYGMARELATIFQTPLKPTSDWIPQPSSAGESSLNIQIEDSSLCPRFSGVIVTGVQAMESPIWMQARLQAAGLNVHNLLVDVTNYVMLELGAPMHAYDRKHVPNDTLIVRHAKKGESLTLLNEQALELHPEDPVVATSRGEILGLAGIKGGLNSGISPDTTEIILEAANWNPITVRKASTRYGLRTDASQRFEKGLDPALTELAIRRALSLIQEACPTAKILGPIVNAGSWTFVTPQIELRLQSLATKLGVALEKTEVIRILTALEFSMEDAGETLKVSVPSHRATGDVSLEEDLVEEIARIYGYDQIPSELPTLPIKLPTENPERMRKHEARRILAHQLGFTEVMNYSFYSKARLDQCGMSEEGHFKVLNYLSEDQTHMRISMTPNMLATVAKNAHQSAQVKIFEIGRCYKKTTAFMPLEEKWLNVSMTSNGKEDVFYQIKGALEAFLNSFGVKSWKLQTSEKALPYAHPKKCMELLVQGKSIGVLFSVHPKTRKAFGIEQEVGVFALNFGALVAAGQNIPRFQDPPKFPGMPFDISVLVDKKAQVADLMQVIQKSDTQKLIQKLELFDTYTGSSIPEGKKSLSFALELRHPERTLTEAEFESVQSGVFLALESFGGTIRGK